jgi:hypothetical protein
MRIRVLGDYGTAAESANDNTCHRRELYIDQDRVAWCNIFYSKLYSLEVFLGLMEVLSFCH